MNRAERRRTGKTSSEFKKLDKTVKGLTPEQTKLIEIVSDQRVLEKIDSIQGVIDLSICAKLIELIPELSLKEVYSINEEIGKMSAEVLKKENELVKRMKGDSDMAKKVTMELKNKVKKESEKLIKAKLSQNKAIEELKKKFVDIPKSLITITYKETKEELKTKEEEKEIEEGTEKIMDIISHKEDLRKSFVNIGDKAREFNKKNNEKMLESKVKEAMPEEIKEFITNKFIPILLKFEGEFATYTKNKDKLVIENESAIEISSLDAIKEMEETEIAGLEQQIKIAKAKYKEFREAFEV